MRDLKEFGTHMLAFAEALKSFAESLTVEAETPSVKADEVTPDQTVEVAPVPDAKLTIEDVRAKLSTIAKTPEGRGRIKDALASVGAARLTEVAPADWSKLLEVLDA